MRKPWLVVVLTLMILIAWVSVSYASSGIYLFVDGKQVDTDTPPQIINGRVMVPVRAISESLGAEVTWSNNIVLVKTIQTSNKEENAFLEELIEFIKKDTDTRTKLTQMTTNEAVDYITSSAIRKSDLLDKALSISTVPKNTPYLTRIVKYLTTSCIADGLLLQSFDYASKGDKVTAKILLEDVYSLQQQASSVLE